MCTNAPWHEAPKTVIVGGASFISGSNLHCDGEISQVKEKNKENVYYKEISIDNFVENDTRKYVENNK